LLLLLLLFCCYVVLSSIAWRYWFCYPLLICHVEITPDIGCAQFVFVVWFTALVIGGDFSLQYGVVDRLVCFKQGVSLKWTRRVDSWTETAEDTAGLSLLHHSLIRWARNRLIRRWRPWSGQVYLPRRRRSSARARCRAATAAYRPPCAVPDAGELPARPRRLTPTSSISSTPPSSRYGNHSFSWASCKPPWLPLAVYVLQRIFVLYRWTGSCRAAWWSG
jgi:hypothetical protein